MKIKALLGFFVFFICGISLVLAQKMTAIEENEARHVSFAERLIIIELVNSLSPSRRKARENVSKICAEIHEPCSHYYKGSGAELEFAIDSIGIGGGNASANALVNLLAVRLDGAGGEGLGCQIAIRGRSLLRYLERLQPKLLIEHCQSIFNELKKLELRDITDVKVEQICHTEDEIRVTRDQWINAIKSDVACELY